MNKKTAIIKKILTPISKAMMFVFTLCFGIVAVGATIANANENEVTSFLGGGGNNIVYIDGEDDAGVSDFYQSDYNSVKEVRGKGFYFSQKMTEEGAVLLRNENNALPLAAGAKVSLFGASSAKPVVSGYREGQDKADGAISFKQGLTDAGLIVNAELYDWYANSDYGRKSLYNSTSFGNVYSINEAPWSELPESKIAADYKTAIFVVSRVGGEATDVQLRDLGEVSRGFDGKNGNYLILSAREEDVLSNLKAQKANGVFDKIVVIMNTTNQVACDFEDKYDVDALIYMGSTGSAGTKAVGEILVGKVNPSGKLADTFWKNHYLNPVLANWGAYSYNHDSANHYSAYPFNGASDYGSVVYREGIYSGYRYTETRYEDTVLGVPSAGDFVYSDAVAYPFGYGLSYSDFEYSDMQMSFDAENDSFEISVVVKNVRGMDGKNAVQLFLQKPYTDYDKDNGIEKASVELIDFAKTETLAAGGDGETVKFTVPRRELACYDSYGERTYIVENGVYYFTVGTDAHAATNNILAAKNKTGMTDPFGAAASGDPALVKTAEVRDADDIYKKYSTSANGTEIVNRFDDVDLRLNTLVNDTDKNISYVSRNDWAGTVKFGFTADGTLTDNYYRVTMTPALRSAMTQTAEGVAGDLPVMGSSATAWQLIDLRADDEGNPIPYDDAKWDELLNQLTYREMANLLLNGYGFTAVMTSISKPRTYDQDSDLGVIGSYASDPSGLASKLADPDKNDHPAAYADNGIVAATRNKALLYEYGLQWGEDCLWSGYTGLYGTGANIHRSPYNGRTYGYYSEDPVLTGKSVAQINIGMEEKGSFMLLKHCMLNEQEAGRIGSSSWANEQTIREVYLRPFQIAIEEGGVQGVMTSLNRLGPVAAPHHTFLNTVLRGEFGMVGYCVTDSWFPETNGNPHMNLPSCLLAGNDLPLGTASVLRDNESKYNTREYANIVWAMRDATHNILYSVVHSNAMNGLSANTRILTFQPEWQYYLDRIVPTLMALCIVSIAFWVGMEVWGYFGNNKVNKPIGENETDR